MAYRRARFLSTLLKTCTTLRNSTLSFSTISFANHFETGFRRRVDAGFRFQTHRIFAGVPQPLSRNAFTFKVSIVTGDVRGAETHADILIKLIGNKGESDFFRISREKGFGKGSVEIAELTSETDIGALRMVLVKREQGDGSLADDSWFLDKLLVEDQHGNEIIFSCMQWLGRSQCGTIEADRMRYLLPKSSLRQENLDGRAESIQIKSSAMVIPAPDKIKKGVKATNKNGRGLGGEDAYFYTFGKSVFSILPRVEFVNRNEIFGMGVADGVHAWLERGIDSGTFAYYLMEQAFLNVRMGYDDVFRSKQQDRSFRSKFVVMKTASRKVETEGVYGSSTCCMLTINMKTGVLNSVVLGDSGFLVAGRRDTNHSTHVIFRSPQQEHEFGWPYQLGHHKHANRPSDAIMDSFQVYPGDTIVMGSDGLFDNLFIPTILTEIRKHRASKKPPHLLVGTLIEMAHAASLERNIETPYSHAFMEALNQTCLGGKKDDITVVVAYIL